MRIKQNSYVIFMVMIFITTMATAQCKIENKTIGNDENVTYDLFFNSGFLKPKAGTGSLTIQRTPFKNNDAYMLKMHLNTSGVVRGFFKMNDTITSYIDTNMRPLYFSKNAEEGKHYSVEKQTYSYSGDEISVHTRRVYDGKQKFDEVLTTNDCTYDFLSVLPLIRNIDYKEMNEGDSKEIHFITGKNIEQMSVIYLGKSKIRARNGKSYNTLEISLEVHDEIFMNKRKAINASLTDDEHRIPVVLDTHLKVGVIRAVMKDMSF